MTIRLFLLHSVGRTLEVGSGGGLEGSSGDELLEEDGEGCLGRSSFQLSVVANKSRQNQQVILIKPLSPNLEES